MNKKEFIELLNNRNIECSDDQYTALLELMKSTLETNEKFNLTAIKDEDEFMEKMIFDSCIPLSKFNFNNKTIIDVGTGAGFPGLVIKILNKESDIYLLDSTSKKITYLKDFCHKKGYNCTLINERCEEYSKKNIEKFDYAICRAFAPLNILLEEIVPMLKIGGTLIAMKGSNYEEEVTMSKNAFKKLGCEIKDIYLDELPFSKEKRALISIKKINKTNEKYPREYKDIKRKPL